MITLYSGTPGSGKSLHLIQCILRNLKRKKDVICNFPIKFSQSEIKNNYDVHFYYWPNEKITVDNLLLFALEQGYFEKKKESQCMVLIDEAGGRFNVRDFAAKDRMVWLDFFSQHRKCGFDFILVAQSDRMIDRQIRTQVETEKRHRKINNFGPFVFLPIPVFVCIEYWYVAKERVSCEFFRYKKRIGNKYDSMAMFEGFRISKELIAKAEAQRKGVLLKCSDLDVNANAIFAKQEDA